eukprot:1821107-Pyramimonas_sp.AAC.1
MIDSSGCSLVHHALLFATSWRHFVPKASHTSCWTCAGRLALSSAAALYCEQCASNDSSL